jgi:hypothetical protein
MAGGGLIVVIVMIGGGALLVTWLIEQGRRKRAQAIATAKGLRYLTGPSRPPDLGFQQFSVGRAKKMRHIFWREGDEHESSVFEYQYTTGSGKNSTTHRITCALFATGMAAPHLVLDRQGMLRRLLGTLGIRDIQLESPPFNDRWHVSCDDERFAITLLDPTMMNWLMSVGGAGSIELEVIGDRGLAISKRLPIDEMPGLLDYTHEFARHIPRVVLDLYPARR